MIMMLPRLLYLCSKSFLMRFSRIFGITYDRFMSGIEKRHLRVRRARLLSPLKGRVLEVGVGTGINFEHYNGDIEVMGIEPSPYMMPQAVKRREVLLFPDKITLHNVGCSYPEMEVLVEPASLDAVVCTLVLCTIPDPARALANFKKWLKPGGKLVVIEHIRSHNHLKGRMQDLANPIWELVAEGCQLNRSTDILILQSGFTLVREEYFRIAIPFYEAEYMVTGDQ
jgi:SAM-dependent methyltransferase